jgi:hypothetical protein
MDDETNAEDPLKNIQSQELAPSMSTAKGGWHSEKLCPKAPAFGAVKN